jgi:branched-chain amino acid transport system ATP-binding protein
MLCGGRDLLRTERVSKAFGGVQAIRELSFALAPGRIQSIIGPNGAGKTTLFNLISGVLAPDQGRIWLAGEDITLRRPFERARLGIARTFQNLQVFLDMSVRENVMLGRHRHLERAFWRCLAHSPRVVRSERACRERAAEILRRVGLTGDPDAAADSLPYGALRRLEIARALATEPVLLLLDEPAAGCNARETQEIDALIQSIAADGVTVLLVEHDMRLVMNVSDHILVLDHGELLAEGSAAGVRVNPLVIEAYLGTAAGAGDAA